MKRMMKNLLAVAAFAVSCSSLFAEMVFYTAGDGVITGGYWSGDYDDAPTRLEIPASIDGVTIVAIRGSSWNWDWPLEQKVTEIALPSGLVEIGENAFRGLYNVESVVIPAGVRKIGDGAFAFLDHLANVTFAGQRDAIDMDFLSAFRGTPYFEAWNDSQPFELVIEDVWVNVWSKSTCAVSEVVSSNKFRAVIGFYGKCPAEITIPEGVQIIGVSAFDHDYYASVTNLEKVTFPSTLVGIRDYAFYDCTSLDNVELPPSLEYIDEAAFYGCRRLAHVNGTIPSGEGVEWAFTGTPFEALRPFELVFEEGEYSVYKRDEYGNTVYEAVGGCQVPVVEKTVPYKTVVGFHGTCPEEVAIPEGVTYVEYAFSLDGERAEDENSGYWQSAANLRKVTLPKSLEYVDGSFNNLPNLEEVEFTGDVAAIEVDWSFVGVPVFVPLIDDGVMYGYCGYGFEEAVVPEGVTRIDEEAFYGCWPLASVTLPRSLKEIAWGAFYGCYNLEDVEFLGGIDGVKIEDGAFCTTTCEKNLPFSLLCDEGSWTDGEGVVHSWKYVYGYRGQCPAQLVIPDGVTDIDDEAFIGCDTLESVTIPATCTYVGEYAFALCRNLATVNADIEVYNEETGEWSGSVECEEGAFYGTAYMAAKPFRLLMEEGDYEQVEYEYDEYGNLVYDDNGDPVVVGARTCHYKDIYGYEGTCPAKLVIPEDATYVARCAFAFAEEIEEVVLPADLDALCCWCEFFGCSNLRKVTLADGTPITKQNGWDYYWLEDAFINTPIYDEGVFWGLIVPGCYGDDHGFEIYDGCLEGYDWWGAGKPDVVEIPATVTEIGYRAFNGLRDAEIVVPGSVEYVSEEAFVNCRNVLVTFLESTNPERWLYIEEGAFYECSDISVDLPVSYFYDEEMYPYDEPYELVYMFRRCHGELAVVAPNSLRDYVYTHVESGGADVFDEEELVENAYPDGYPGWAVRYLAKGLKGEEPAYAVVTANLYVRPTYDAKGGVIDGVPGDRFFGNVEELPGASRDGYVFQGWSVDGLDVDSDLFLYLGRNDDVVTFEAKWGVEFDVCGIGEDIDLTLTEGEPYGDVLDVLSGAVTPTRHGQTLAGWVDGAGAPVTPDRLVKLGDELNADWDSFNPLCPEDAAVTSTLAQTYDAYVLDADGGLVGTVAFKLAKSNNGAAAVTATAQVLGSGKKMKFKSNGKAALSKDGATEVVLSGADKTMTVEIGADGVFGKFGSYEISGIRNMSKKDARAGEYAQWVRTVAVAFDAEGVAGSGAAFGNGYSSVSVAIAAKGKVKVTGTMADGTKVNAKGQLLISDDGTEACVPVLAPMYAGKSGGFGFVLWLRNGGAATVESVSGWNAGASKTPFKAKLVCTAVGGAAAGDGDAEFSLDDELPATISGGSVVAASGETSLLPVGIAVSRSGGKLSVAAADKVKLDRASGTVVVTGGNGNASALKLKCTPANGSFKGSLVVYTMVGGRLKKVKANVFGVMVDGKGYGSAVIKNVGTFGVTIK